MEVSVRLEDRSRYTWAVHVDGDCIARGLPRAEANRIRVQIQRGELKTRSASHACNHLFPLSTGLVTGEEPLSTAPLISLGVRFTFF
jgi:hypothetical protein